MRIPIISKKIFANLMITKIKLFFIIYPGMVLNIFKIFIFA